ncbi:uncharacterized protein LOC144318534 isoform X2 [Canis aureus]
MRFDEDWNGLIRQGSHPHTFIFIIPVSTYSAGMSSVSTCVTYMTSQLWNQPFLQRLLVPFNGQWRMVFRHQDLDVSLEPVSDFIQEASEFPNQLKDAFMFCAVIPFNQP